MLHYANIAARALGLDVSTFFVFALLSVLFSIASALLFYRMLLSYSGIGRREVQLAVAGLLASNAFLVLTVSDEPFLVQLPFIILAAGSLSRWSLQGSTSSLSVLFSAGAWMAVAALFSIHNVILAVALVIFVLASTAQTRWLAAVGAYAGGGISIGLPAFVIAYAIAAPDATFIAWLTTYTEGISGISTGASNVYGLKPLLLSIARIGTAIMDAFAYDGGLATLAKRELFGLGLDFLPDYRRALWGSLNVAVFGLIAAVTVFHRGQARCRRSAGTLLLIATLSYSLFGLFWSGKAAQFWIPLVPFFWLFVATTATADSSFSWLTRQRYFGLIAVCSVLMWAGNTWLGIAPEARFDAAQARHDYRLLLEPAEILVVPGWDYNWTLQVHRDLGIPIYHLYEMAIRNPTYPPIEELKYVVKEALDDGRTVYVTRLYDIDHMQRPWNQLEQINWPRSRIQSLLDEYCTVVVGTAYDITVRRIHACKEDL